MKTLLRVLAQVLDKRAYIEIVGHPDSSGSDEKNIQSRFSNKPDLPICPASGGIIRGLKKKWLKSLIHRIQKAP